MGGEIKMFNIGDKVLFDEYLQGKGSGTIVGFKNKHGYMEWLVESDDLKLTHGTKNNQWYFIDRYLTIDNS
jgi:hypothetical protein